MNPQDASDLDITDGELVRVSSRRGEMNSRVLITDRSPRGMIFTTFHFKESPVNMLTNDALDPTGKIPEYKVCGVKVVKIPEDCVQN
jgi:predicted molibdopterin-dependent oxidoreductase YjgC